MCRSIKTLFNYIPKATVSDIEAASLQFVRKVSGSRKPSKANEAAFNTAIAEIAKSTQKLLNSLQTNATPRVRE